MTHIEQVRALVSALDDAVATLAAVRATAGTEDWPHSGQHFSGICLESLKASRAALSALDLPGIIAAMEGWRPIESAPEDEVIILGWPAGEKFPGKVAFGRFGGMAWPSHRGVRAKHWRPLPAPPAEGEAG